MYTSSRSRSFLLFEVLIALLLVTLCIGPLMRLPILHFRRQIEHLSQFELRRLSDWTFSEIKESFLKEAFPWETLPSRGETSSTYRLPDALLELPALRSKKVRRSFVLKCVGEKEGVKGASYRLYEITLFLNRKKMIPPYRLLVKKEEPLSEENREEKQRG